MITIDGNTLTIEDVVAVAHGFATVSLSAAAVSRVERARAVVDRQAAGQQPVYGVNTGFGPLAEVKIPRESLGQLQLNLLRSHAAGVDEPLPVAAVRATMLLRANVLAKGYSGIRVATLQLLVDLLNRHVHPLVPARGSVGASGDLAPLAHLALVLVGEGRVLGNGSDRVLRGADALRHAGLEAVELHAKEGLALINGTQPSAALLALAIAGAERLARAADIVAALSIDALKGSIRPFDPRIHAARPFAGQAASARNIGRLLDDSPINRSHEGCGRVQDAYSLRCAAQVHGAAREALGFARHVASIEINAGTDNPMVFADEEEIVSGGNFHGAPVALAADLLAIALAQIATISERRADRLVNPGLSGLPPFLVRESGLRSGLMMAQVTAAALASEIKLIAHPASVDTIPTSGNREDHVSMSMTATLKAGRALDLTRHVVAVELLCACQAIDLLAPLTPSPALLGVHRAVREHVPVLEEDRSPSADIAAIADLLATGAIERACGAEVK